MAPRDLSDILVIPKPTKPIAVISLWVSSVSLEMACFLA